MKLSLKEDRAQIDDTHPVFFPRFCITSLGTRVHNFPALFGSKKRARIFLKFVFCGSLFLILLEQK